MSRIFLSTLHKVLNVLVSGLFLHPCGGAVEGFDHVTFVFNHFLTTMMFYPTLVWSRLPSLFICTEDVGVAAGTQTGSGGLLRPVSLDQYSSC